MDKVIFHGSEQLRCFILDFLYAFRFWRGLPMTCVLEAWVKLVNWCASVNYI